jgi:uncharacterized membrane protein YdbT with pleckstrin-like domain
VTSSTCGDAPAGFLGLIAAGGVADRNNAAVTGIPQRLLGDGEHVEMVMRPHWKELVGPALLLLVLTPAATYAAAAVPEGSPQPWLRLVIAVLALLILLRWAVWPFLGWLTTSYVVTDRRLITRHGIIARHGRDMPLSRINDVSFEHASVFERVLGCGTLIVESAGERGQLVLRDVPHVEEVQRDVYRLAEDDEERRRGERDRADLDDDHRGW